MIEMHGGGPPGLKVIPPEDALRCFGHWRRFNSHVESSRFASSVSQRSGSMFGIDSHDSGASRHRFDLTSVRVLSVFAAVAITASCFPYPYVARPGASGTVVDAESAAPIANAAVTLNIRLLNGSVIHAPVTTTDANGVFVIAPQYMWALYVVLQEAVRPRIGTLEVQAATYSNATREISFRPENHTRLAVGEVRLIKQK